MINTPISLGMEPPVARTSCFRWMEQVVCMTLCWPLWVIWAGLFALLRGCSRRVAGKSRTCLSLSPCGPCMHQGWAPIARLCCFARTGHAFWVRMASPAATRPARLAFVSDTHNLHSSVSLPADLDAVVHCGDMLATGSKFRWLIGRHPSWDLAAGGAWLAEHGAKQTVFVPGNHDGGLDPLLPGGELWRVVRSYLSVRLSATGSADPLLISGHPDSISLDTVNEAVERAARAAGIPASVTVAAAKAVLLAPRVVAFCSGFSTPGSSGNRAFQWGSGRRSKAAMMVWKDQEERELASDSGGDLDRLTARAVECLGNRLVHECIMHAAQLARDSPHDTRVLVTHSGSGRSQEMREALRPSLHAFGHIHEGAGVARLESYDSVWRHRPDPDGVSRAASPAEPDLEVAVGPGTGVACLAVCASICDGGYFPLNPSIVVDCV
jgi:hypothetical protein